MGIDFEVLAFEHTQLGPLCLRRRRTLDEPREWVTEVTLDHEFLMSSLHTRSECQLASLALERVSGSDLDVLVGGLGLGYTAWQALQQPRVERVKVVELLPQVICWTRQGLIPLAETLNADERLTLSQGSIFSELLATPKADRWDAILIDVDHSPEDRLDDGDARFYSVEGLRRAAAHLKPHGVLALWSYASSTAVTEAMHEVFREVHTLPIEYFNRHVQQEYTDWLLVGCCSPP